MTTYIDPESLVAYVDGQLDQSETARVELALAENPEARETVRRLRESAELLRSAFNEPLNAPVPARVLEAIHLATPERPREGIPWRRAWPVALAASLALLIIGLGGGLLLVDYRVEQELARLQAVGQADQSAREAALFQALEENVSGEAVAWRNPDNGRIGEITPVRTFKNRVGQWCREYTAMEALAGETAFRRAIACRVPEGQWKTRAVLISDS
jgi:anti-sigma factor RsiW